MPLVAGVDSSTSACKVEVRDADTGELVASRRAPAPADHAAPQRAAPAGLVGGLRGRVRRGRRARPPPSGGDRRRRPAARPGRARRDRRRAAPGEALERHRVGRRRRGARRPRSGGATAWAAACGSVPVASFTITKLRGSAACEPEVFGRVAQVLLPHDWLTGRLTGRAPPPIAATRRAPGGGRRPRSATGLDLLALVDDARAWDGVLPEVLAPQPRPAGEWDGRGRRRPARATTWPPRSGSGSVPATSRSASAPAAPPSCVSDRPSADPSGTVAGFADATGRYLPLRLHAQRDQGHRRRRPAARCRRRRARRPGARRDRPVPEGLVLVPHLDGERTPNRPDATGHPHRHPLRRDPRAARSRRGRGRRRATCWPGGRAGRAGSRRSPRGGWCSSAAAPAARPTARSSPTSPAGPSSSPTPTSSSPAVRPCRPRRCSPGPRSPTSASAWGSGAGATIDARSGRRRRRHPGRVRRRGRSGPADALKVGRGARRAIPRALFRTCSHLGRQRRAMIALQPWMPTT